MKQGMRTWATALLAVCVVMVFACGTCSAATPTKTQLLIKELETTPWAGPSNITIPTHWMFRFTRPMRAVLKIGHPAQDDLIAALDNPDILEQVIILLGGVGDERAVPHIIDKMTDKSDYGINLCANLALTNITVAAVIWHHGGGMPGPQPEDPKKAWAEWWMQNAHSFRVKEITTSRRYSNYPDYGIYRWDRNSREEVGSWEPNPPIESGEQLVIRVPKGIDEAKLSVWVDVYGQGLGLEPAHRSGPGEYRVGIPGWTRGVKLLIYHPQYKVIAVTTDRWTAVSGAYTPKFVKAAMVPLAVRLVDTSGKAFANQQVSVSVALGLRRYFGYSDGPSYGGWIASGKTNANGEFATSAPWIPDDPYFRSCGVRSLSIHVGNSMGSAGDAYDVLPYPDIPQRKQGSPVTVTVQHRGRITGYVSRSFLQSHGIVISDETVVKVRRSDGVTTTAPIEQSSGSFQTPISACSYDLTVEWRDGDNLRQADALKDVVVGEQENKAVSID